MKEEIDKPATEEVKSKATEQNVEVIEQPKKSSTPRSSKRWKGIAIGIAIGILICLGVGFGGISLYTELTRNNAQVTQRQTPVNDGNKVITKEEEGIASVAEKVGPSVVSIVTKSQSMSARGLLEEEGAGTGIIVGKDGYVLTNKHVVNGTDTVGVILADGTSYNDVKVLGVDPLNDVAFLKIPDVSNLPVAELGDSTSVRVGQKVVAIGNSLGQYQNTVTSGIISGTGRPISAQAGDSVENLTDLIQTDAAINPGNSGGPLLNLQGQVIGINTAIIENAQEIGFSIPISSTKGILKGILAGGPVERAYLGINYLPITADVAKHYNLPVKKGAYVFSSDSQTAIVKDGPADQAGIKDKDIITKVGNIEVGDRGGVSSLVSEYAPGDTIEVTILRGGQTMVVKVKLAAYKS
jgi:serine protease Do